eukprot:m.258164 g.258164  ORF g.258164 m.258164 type:complete len:137 (+) comp26615_c0_seq2:495-905(+)
MQCLNDRLDVLHEGRLPDREGQLLQSESDATSCYHSVWVHFHSRGFTPHRPRHESRALGLRTIVGSTGLESVAGAGLRVPHQCTVDDLDTTRLPPPRDPTFLPAISHTVRVTSPSNSSPLTWQSESSFSSNKDTQS